MNFNPELQAHHFFNKRKTAGCAFAYYEAIIYYAKE